MNRYTLDADGRRWWWAPALAGAVATAAITAVIAMPVVGEAMPAPTTRREPAPSYTVPAVGTPKSNAYCFIYRANWNLALDGPRPLCDWGVTPESVRRVQPTLLRPGLDSRP
jgi:hypothetical protein